MSAINTLLYAEKARELAAKGITTIPLDGKKPRPTEWQTLRATTPELITEWETKGWWTNIGMVTGEASRNIVVIDFDGLEGFYAFERAFPDLRDTYIVKTGSGNGMHVYYMLDLLPDSRDQKNIELNGQKVNIEFKANGRQVVIPPSIHPDTGEGYTKYHDVAIMRLSDLSQVWAWACSLKPQDWVAPVVKGQGGKINPQLLRDITARFTSQPHKVHGAWINTQCPNTNAHRHGDRTYSFGWNEQSAVGHCYVCGEMLVEQLIGYIHINPETYGGIFLNAQPGMNGKHDLSRAPQGAPLPIPVITRKERLTAYIDRINDDKVVSANPPVPFPFRCLHHLHGEAHYLRAGQLIGIIGASGTGKTSLLESMVDGWLDMHVPCLVWSPEWDADDFIARSVQRYGGATTEEVNAHEAAVYEQATFGKVLEGKLMSGSVRSASIEAIRHLRKWETQVGYLEMPMLTYDYLRDSLAATLASLTFKPRVLVIDYVQLLHALEERKTEMYHLLMRLKALCKQYKLTGAIACQVTKKDSRSASDGQLLDTQSARYVNDDPFNLFMTINPDRNPDTGTFLQSAVLNVVKNSNGIKDKVRVPTDWEKLYFSDTLHPDQTFND